MALNLQKVREELKYAMMECGEQFVTKDGIMLLSQLCAGNWDTLLMVCNTKCANTVS